MEVIAVGTAAIDVVHEVAVYPEGPFIYLQQMADATNNQLTLFV